MRRTRRAAIAGAEAIYSPIPNSLREKTMKRIFASLVSTLFCASVFAADAPAKKAGDILVDSSGMTLYFFDKDQAGSGKSVCNGSCATAWPPHVAPATAQPAGDYSVVTRDDGTKQWAHKGRPLYRWVKDQKAGDRT